MVASQPAPSGGSAPPAAELVAFTLIAPVVFNTILKLGLTAAIAGRRGTLVPGAALKGAAAVLLATIAATVFFL